MFSFIRYGDDGTPPMVVVSNMAPVVREGFRFGLPQAGNWRERLNTDAAEYGGSGVGNGEGIRALEDAMHGLPASTALTLPPLATIFLSPE